MSLSIWKQWEFTWIIRSLGLENLVDLVLAEAQFRCFGNSIDFKANRWLWRVAVFYTFLGVGVSLYALHTNDVTHCYWYRTSRYESSWWICTHGRRPLVLWWEDSLAHFSDVLLQAMLDMRQKSYCTLLCPLSNCKRGWRKNPDFMWQKHTHRN